jgi:hypothetical protein
VRQEALPEGTLTAQLAPPSHFVRSVLFFFLAELMSANVENQAAALF